MSWPIIIFTLPTLVLGWLLGILGLTLGVAENPRIVKGVFVSTWRPWVAKRWKYSTTIAACMWMHPEHGEYTEYHEFIHVKQYEDLNLLGAVLGGFCCIISWRLGLILWASSGAPWLLMNFLSGWIREGDPYMGSEHEKSAYAQTREHRL